MTGTPRGTRAGIDQEQREGCALCRVRLASDTSKAGVCGIAAYIDDDVVALIDRNLPGVVVAPRSHVAALAMSASPARVLTAVRRAALHIEAWYEAPRVGIAPVTDMSGAFGHVCYQVVPASRDHPVVQHDDDLAAESRHLANRLAAKVPPRELHSSR